MSQYTEHCRWTTGSAYAWCSGERRECPPGQSPWGYRRVLGKCRTWCGEREWKGTGEGEGEKWTQESQNGFFPGSRSRPGLTIDQAQAKLKSRRLFSLSSSLSTIPSARKQLTLPLFLSWIAIAPVLSVLLPCLSVASALSLYPNSQFHCTRLFAWAQLLFASDCTYCRVILCLLASTLWLLHLLLICCPWLPPCDPELPMAEYAGNHYLHAN